MSSEKFRLAEIPGDIFTLTLNPSIDYFADCERFDPQKLNRYERASYAAGGKGINVSLVLKELGIPSSALGLSAGFTGGELLRLLCEKGIKEDFIRLKEGFTRINIKLLRGFETELNGAGPTVQEEDEARLAEKIASIPAGSLLVLSGSVPKGLQKGVYKRLIEKTGALAAVDAGGVELREAIKAKPLLIKPNLSELSELFGEAVTSLSRARLLSRELVKSGVGSVLLSLGDKGSLFTAEGIPSLYTESPGGELVSSCAAGDSLLAGFIAGMKRRLPLAECLRLASSSGAAAAFSVGCPSCDKIKELLSRQKAPTVAENLDIKLA